MNIQETWLNGCDMIVEPPQATAAMSRAFLVLLLLTLSLLCLVGVQGDYTSTLTSLRASLTGNTSSYDNSVRPGQFVSVTVECVLRSLLKLDISQQAMQLKVFWDVWWTDSRLTWTPADWDNIDFIYLPITDVWFPPLLLDNSVDDDAVYEPEGPALLSYNGTITIGIDSAKVTSCDVSTRQFPFDEQTCIVTLQLLGLAMHFDLAPTSAPLYTGMYHVSAEWELVQYSAAKTSFSRNNLLTLPQIDYTLKFRRLVSYYYLAMIIPILFLMSLICTVFWVPIESGEKLGYCLTLLLNFVVLLTTISDDLPPLAKEVNYLQLLLAIAMSASVLSTIITILVLYLYHKEESAIPQWLARATTLILHPCKGRSCRNRTEATDKDDQQGECDSISKSKVQAPSEVTWKMVAVAIDKLCLVIFIAFSIPLALGFMVAMS